MKGSSGVVLGRLTSMFPVDKSYNPKIRSPWLFRCLCGELIVQSYSAAYNGRNNSCGCMKKSKSTLEVKLRALKYLSEGDKEVTLVQDGVNFKSRDWTFKCNTCEITRSNLNAWEVLRTEKRFCACSGKVTCNSSEEAVEDLNKKLKGTTWTLHEFPKEFTTKKDCWVKLNCKVCNTIHSSRFGNSYRKGCPACANKATTVRLSKDSAWFVEKCNEIHNFKYDYSKVVYKKAREKVEIMCNDHQEPFVFWQSPDNHKNKRKGCPECKRLRLKHVAFKLSRAEQNKEIYRKLPSGVYLNILSNGVSKIGLSCDLNRRNPEIRRCSGLEVKTRYYRTLNLYDSLKLENELHKYFSDKQYKWEEEWQGHTECFSLVEDEQKLVEAFIKNYEDTDE